MHTIEKDKSSIVVKMANLVVVKRATFCEQDMAKVALLITIEI